MSSYTIGQLIAVLRHKRDILKILNRRDFEIKRDCCSLHVGQFCFFLDLIKIFRDATHTNTNININVSDIFDIVYCINDTIDCDHAKQFVDIITEENYSIEKMLHKIYNSDAIINVVNAAHFIMINYDQVFDRALNYNVDNRAIFEYIVSNNYIDYNGNGFNYRDREFELYDFLDVLLTHGFDISNFPTDCLNVSTILDYISLSNIKYFSNVKIDFAQYISILMSLDSDKLKEFLRWFNTDNIVHRKSNNIRADGTIDRAQILIDNGINLKSMLNVIIDATNNCECDCLARIDQQ